MPTIAHMWNLRARIGNSIFDTFPCQEPPHASSLVPLVKCSDGKGGWTECLHEDAEYVVRLFDGKLWTEIVPQLLVGQGYSSIFFWLTADAAAYYLPAFLLVSTFDLRSDNDITGYIFDRLIPPEREDFKEKFCSEMSYPPVQQEIDKFVRLCEILSKPKKQLIVDFLEYKAGAISVLDPNEEYELALRALADYWRAMNE